MAIYTVHLPPLADAGQRLAGAQFVKDGFVYAAFAGGPFWLAGKRLWLSALIAFLLIIAFWAVGFSLGLSLGVPIGLVLLLSIGIGLEGSSLRRWRFRRRGWSEAAIVSARTLEEAERRFFETALAEPTNASSGQAAPSPPTQSLAPQDGGGGRGGSVLGLFPEPGARA
jgi:hypothetical protein